MTGPPIVFSGIAFYPQKWLIFLPLNLCPRECGGIPIGWLHRTKSARAGTHSDFVLNRSHPLQKLRSRSLVESDPTQVTQQIERGFHIITERLFKPLSP